MKYTFSQVTADFTPLVVPVPQLIRGAPPDLYSGSSHVVVFLITLVID